MPRFAVDAARSAEARPRAARSAAPSGVGAEMSPRCCRRRQSHAPCSRGGCDQAAHARSAGVTVLARLSALGLQIAHQKSPGATTRLTIQWKNNPPNWGSNSSISQCTEWSVHASFQLPMRALLALRTSAFPLSLVVLRLGADARSRSIFPAHVDCDGGVPGVGCRVRGSGRCGNAVSRP